MDSRSREIFSVILFKNTSNVLLSQGEMHHIKEMKSVSLICYPAMTNNALGVAFKKVWNKPGIKMTFLSYFDDQDKVKWLDEYVIGLMCMCIAARCYVVAH